MNKEHPLVIDLGVLGTCVMEDIDPFETEEGFTVVMDGYTSEGVRVHMVKDDKTWFAYPQIWKNAVLIKMEEQ